MAISVSSEECYISLTSVNVYVSLSLFFFSECELTFVRLSPPSADGSWNCDKPEVLKLGVLPIKAMLAVEEHLWAASGGQVFIISAHTHCVEVGGTTEQSRGRKVELVFLI